MDHTLIFLSSKLFYYYHYFVDFLQDNAFMQKHHSFQKYQPQEKVYILIITLEFCQFSLK